MTKKKNKVVVKKDKWGKKDYINLGILTFVFFLLIVLTLKKGLIYASTTDWPSQYSVIPNFFRELFYKTGNFLPDFAFNLGAGQNIYNFSYYGLFNPFISLSFLFPFWKMEYFIPTIAIIAILSSVLLFYKFLRNHKYSLLISLTGSFVFMGATSLMFHTHRHIMFVDYMPFLILGLMGVDKYFKENKSWLMVLGIILMILTSYYYSVVGLVAIVIYGIYVYLKKNNKVTFKSFMLDGFKFLAPIFIAIFSVMILLLPTLLVILKGRESINVVIKLKDILLPSINLDYILYKYYGIGLSAIAIPSIVNLFFKKKEDCFLGIMLSLMVICPLFVYLFNGGMYLDAKVLIPLLPMYALAITIFLNDLLDKKRSLWPILAISIPLIIVGSLKMELLKYVLWVDSFITIICLLLTKKYSKNLIICLTTMVLVCGITLFASKKDTLVNYNDFYKNDYVKEEYLANYITDKDKSLYRIVNNFSPTTNANRIFANIDYYQSTIYSSTYNVLYKDFYYNIMNNPIQSRNQFIQSSPKNYPFLLLLGHKYLLTKDTPYMGYLKVLDKDGVSLYKNDNVLPLAYASSNLVSLDTFNALGYPYNQEVILNNIIVDKKINNKPVTHLEKTSLDLDTEELAKLNYKITEGVYVFDVDKNTTIVLPLKKKISNELLYIHFDLLESNSCDVGDTSITINGINNKLTCETWKYHNQNYTFDYVLATDTIDELKIKLSKGSYKIKNIETYTLDYGYVNNLNDKIDEFNFDKKETKGDTIKGDIDVKKDGYFVLSVPYDEGFKAYVDGKKVDVEKVNYAFLGFPITKGHHDIEIKYTAPGKVAGLILSVIGLVSYGGLIIYEKRKEKRKK